jgi:hypothetical protein
MSDVCTSAVVTVPVVGKISLKVIGGRTEPITGTTVVADADALLLLLLLLLGSRFR